MNKATGFLFALLFFIRPLLQGQPKEVYFQHLSAKDGLSYGSVRNMLQDRQGYLWFGTGDGLNRYDGYRFTVFHQEVGKTGSLSSSFITAQAEDAKGYHWVGTNNGLNRYDPRTERFVTFPLAGSTAKTAQLDNITALLTDRQNTLWIGTESGGLFSLQLNDSRNADPKTARFKPFVSAPRHKLTEASIMGLFRDHAENLWVMTRGGVYLQRPGAQAFEPAFAEGVDYLKDYDYVFSITEDREDHSIFFLTTHGLFRYDPQKRNYELALPNFEKPLIEMVQDAQGTFWLTSHFDGLWSWNRKSGRLRSYAHEPAKPGSLAKGQPLTLFQDRAGSLWVGVWKNGLSRLDPQLQQFNEYACANGQTFSNPGNKVKGLAEDKNGNLWISHYDKGEIVRLNRADCSTKTYQIPKSEVSYDDGNLPTCLTFDPKGGLWIGTQRQGLYLLDPATEKITSYEEEFKRLGAKNAFQVNDISIDKKGRVWVAHTNGGVVCFEPDKHRLEQFLNAGTAGQLSSDDIGAIKATADGAVWAGSLGGGLNRIDPETNKVTSYPWQEGQPGYFPATTILSFHEDRKQRLWVGTTLGLFYLDRKQQRFTHYGEAQGLKNRLAFSICEDAKGNIWLNTEHYLSRLDLKTGRFTNFNVSENRSAEAGATSASLLSRTGELFFGQTDGLIGFHPDYPKRNPFVPPVVLTGVQLLNKPLPIGKTGKTEEPVLPTAPAFAKEVTLDYFQDVVTFEFAALNFTQSEKNQYAYQLVGFDEDWVQAGNKRSATYTNLDPGTYTFRVKGSNNDGLWNEAGQTLTLTILPPPWRTWWAYGIYVLAGAGMLYSLSRYSSSRERWSHALRLRQLETQKLHELDQLKTHFFTNISHEFRTPLTLILGPLQKWLTPDDPEPARQKDLKLIQRNANRLLQLINQLLDISKLEAGSLKLQAVEQEVVRYSKGIVYSFSSLAETAHIKFTFRSTEKELPLYFDQDKLEKILTNLLSNALKFTPEGGTVEVTLEKAASQAVLTVKDTGIGIPADRLPLIFNRFYQVDGSHTRQHEGTGIGLALIRELVELHHGEITVTSEPGKGTAFRVALPLGKEHLKPEEISTEPLPKQDIALSHAELLTDLPAALPLAIEDETTAPLLLLVEDNHDVRQYIRSNFEEEYRILEAPDGEQGLALAIEHVPDLIITDLMMPKMDGVELCRQLKLDERSSHIPVILLTAKATVESRVEGLETGADDYLTKPFQPQELQVRVRNLIRQRQLLRERYRQTEAAQVTTANAAETLKLEPGEVLVTSADKKFLERAIRVVEQFMADETFDVERFGEEMALSRVQLYRKIKALTGHTATEFIRSLRLKRAASLLRQGAGNVAEVGYQTGFQNMSYFAKCFKEQFGCTPSEFVASEPVAEPKK